MAGMRRSMAALSTAVFLATAPGVVVGVVPWLLSGWRATDVWLPVRGLGVVFVAVGVAVIVATFTRFVGEGSGTPAPVAPTDTLVVGGLYRHVRNPMYLAVVATILGQSLWLGRPVLVVYAVAVWAVVAAFVHWYEEPSLARRYGALYDRYRRAVPAWRPRLHAWRGLDQLR
jgi:protein-S-isoprenylcysteine O-methyltransferase Ste14